MSNEGACVLCNNALLTSAEYVTRILAALGQRFGRNLRKRKLASGIACKFFETRLQRRVFPYSTREELIFAPKQLVGPLLD